jgi:DNA-binding beta-propeller fold protein YncE
MIILFDYLFDLEFGLWKIFYILEIVGERGYVNDSETNTVIATIPVGFSQLGIAYTDHNQRMYVTKFDDDTVSVNDYISPIPLNHLKAL